jgi:molybdopterin molybdotransferase
MPRVSDPIAIAEARRRVLAEVHPLPTEDLPLGEALGRILAEPLVADIDVPPFDSSAMDGFAVRSGPAAELRVTAESRAGRPAEVTVEPGTAVRISTGAAVPEGADAVVPVEHTEDRGHTVTVPVTEPGANVRHPGEDVRKGDTLLDPGAPLGPAELGVAASVGRPTLACARRPRVALVVTGDELTRPGDPLGPGRIYSSNAYALAAQIERAGGDLVSTGSVGDDPGATREALERALDDAEVVCVSGGVSVGPHDHVRPALGELGVAESFWGVSLRPGKPTWFGTRGPTLVFGLPGNPVSAMVTFQLFARPALLALQGASPEAPRATARMSEPVRRHPQREQAVRVRLIAAEDGWRAEPTGAQGSHVLTSMLGADALAMIPGGEGEVTAGDRVDVEVL